MNYTNITKQNALWDKFFQVIESNIPGMVAYIYRLDKNGKPDGKYWRKCTADPFMPEMLQRSGGGDFRIIIRRNRQIIFSGRLGFSPIDLKMKIFIDALC